MYGEVCEHTAASPSRLRLPRCAREPAGSGKGDEEGRNGRQPPEPLPGQRAPGLSPPRGAGSGASAASSLSS